jgi:hypothetical protein
MTYSSYFSLLAQLFSEFILQSFYDQTLLKETYLHLVQKKLYSFFESTSLLHLLRVDLQCPAVWFHSFDGSVNQGDFLEVASAHGIPSPLLANLLFAKTGHFLDLAF